MQVRRHFRPELLNRLDEIVIFDPLSHEQLTKVARLQMKDVALRLAERGVALAVTDVALDIVLSESYDPVSTYLPIVSISMINQEDRELIESPCLTHSRCMVQDRLEDG